MHVRVRAAALALAAGLLAAPTASSSATAPANAVGDRDTSGARCVAIVGGLELPESALWDARRASFLFATLLVAMTAAAQPASVRSPDGQTTVTVDVDKNGSPRYEVARNGVEIMPAGFLGMRFQSQPAFDDGFRVSRWTRTTKRALDLLASAAMLVLAAPVMLAVALAIALADGRPVLYSQERTGRGGRPYRIWKFRTMRRDAERLGAAWATETDPRVLPVGRFLRRARLDELPQLWNVLRGDMSLVGPRPEREVFLAELKARWPLFTLRELVKPGLTGWAQLKYGYGSTIEEQGKKLEYDLYYVKNASLFLDLVCLLATAKVVLLGTGAR